MNNDNDHDEDHVLPAWESKTEPPPPAHCRYCGYDIDPTFQEGHKGAGVLHDGVPIHAGCRPRVVKLGRPPCASCGLYHESPDECGRSVPPPMTMDWMFRPKSPRCFDCGGLHAEGQCVLTKVTFAAERAAGALTGDELAALGWLVRTTTGGLDPSPRLAAIAGLFDRAATRLEARFADLEELRTAIAIEAKHARGEPQWFYQVATGSQARDAGNTIAVRCRACGSRWEHADLGDVPKRCPVLACKFGGGEVSP